MKSKAAILKIIRERVFTKSTLYAIALSGISIWKWKLINSTLDAYIQSDAFQFIVSTAASSLIYQLFIKKDKKKGKEITISSLEVAKEDMGKTLIDKINV